MEWIRWIIYTEQKDIQHARNGSEVRIGKYKVDGCFGKVVYEFLGCLWHGCKRYEKAWW